MAINYSGELVSALENMQSLVQRQADIVVEDESGYRYRIEAVHLENVFGTEHIVIKVTE